MNKFEIALNVAVAQSMKFFIEIDCLGTYDVE